MEKSHDYQAKDLPRLNQKSDEELLLLMMKRYT